MKRGQIIEGVVERTEFPCKGIIEAEGKPVEVKNALAGQKVRVRLSKVRGGKAEGRLQEVLERSPEEVTPDCVHFGVCGGCCYRTLPYEKQLMLKEKQVKALLESVGCGDTFEGIHPSPIPEGYRNKMEFTFGDEYKDGPMSLGMHVSGSFHDIVTVSGCQIVDEDFRQILLTALDVAKESGLPYYHRMRQEGYFRHLLVRKAAKTGQILVDLVTTSRADQVPVMDTDMKLVNRLTALEQEGKLQGHIAGILHTKNDSVADAVINQGTLLLYGEDHFYEELLGLKFCITPFSFFQTNSLGAEVLYEQVRTYIGETKDKVIFDLYSGTGTIAQILAPVAAHVTGVEIVEEAVEAAKENAKLNGLTNCDFIAGDVLKVVDELTEKPDLIVLDPPRDGIHPKALNKIINFGVDRIVYVSCKPTSLMRDLVIFKARGYTVEKTCCVDMFPGTSHVETVVLLSKGHVDSQKVRVEFSLEDMDMSKFCQGATYKQIHEYVLERTGLNVSNLYIAQIKQKHGIIERENYNKAKSENARVPNCPPEKEAAITEALKHFHMI